MRTESYSGNSAITDSKSNMVLFSRPAQALSLAVAFTAAVTMIYFVPNAMMWDDLTWFWVFQVHGASAIFEYMNQAAHPGYGPVLSTILWIGGYETGRAATALGLAFHLVAAVIFWRILHEARTGDRFPVIAASLFLVAPCVALRGSVAHVQYDFFIFLYLLSIWLSGRSSGVARICAVLCVAGGLSIEPLAALEFLRWWYFRSKFSQGRPAIVRLVPFALIVAAAIIIRLTWLQPYGAYAGYNKLHLDLLEWPARLWAHLKYYFDVFKLSARLTGRFLQFDNPIVIAFVAMGTVLIAAAQATLDHKVGRRDIFAVGGIIMVCGALPYVALDQAPHWQGFSSRFAVASQFGAILLLAALIDRIRRAALFSVVVGLLFFGFSAAQIQFGKWMIYDALMMRSIRAALADFYSNSPPQTAMVRFVPASRHFLFRERCLSLNDMNVLLDLDGNRHGSFGYDVDCVSPGDPVITQNRCSVSGRDSGACPAIRTNLEFRVAPGEDRYYVFSTVDLISRWRQGGINAGALTVLSSSGNTGR